MIGRAVRRIGASILVSAALAGSAQAADKVAGTFTV
jgi:hypothetical protein